MTSDSSHKPIDIDERLILALDVATASDARALVDELGEHVKFYKLGLELLMGGEYFDLIRFLKQRKKRIFVDLKFFDVPRTVAAAVRSLNSWEVDFATVHGNDSIMQAAASAADGVKILAVTALTSLDRGDLQDLGFACDVEALVLSRARRALALGCHGVIASGLEAPALRQHIDHRLLVITPGIRPVDNDQDDQKRTTTIEKAFANGADYIVIGRPIVQASDPVDAARSMQKQIAKTFAD